MLAVFGEDVTFDLQNNNSSRELLNRSPVRDNGNVVGLHNRKHNGVQGDYLSVFNRSVTQGDTVVAEKPNVGFGYICTSAAAQFPHRN